MADGKSPEPLSRAALEVLRKRSSSKSDIEGLFGFMETACATSCGATAGASRTVSRS